MIQCQYYFSYKTHRSHQTTYESPTPTPTVTEYEMPVSIYTNEGNGYEEPAVEFRASAVYHTIPIGLMDLFFNLQFDKNGLDKN